MLFSSSPQPHYNFIEILTAGQKIILPVIGYAVIRIFAGAGSEQSSRFSPHFPLILLTEFI